MPKFNSYTANERNRTQRQSKLDDFDKGAMTCPTCGSQFFEQVEVSKFRESHNIILGQKIPPKPGSMGYMLLRCICCQEWQEPRLQHNIRDIGYKEYQLLLKTLAGKKDTRQSKDQIEAQEV